jgi:hypothetical protein
LKVLPSPPSITSRLLPLSASPQYKRYFIKTPSKLLKAYKHQWLKTFPSRLRS